MTSEFMRGVVTGHEVERKTGEARHFAAGYRAGQANERDWWETRVNWVVTGVAILAAIGIVVLSVGGVL